MRQDTETEVGQFTAEKRSVIHWRNIEKYRGILWKYEATLETYWGSIGEI